MYTHCIKAKNIPEAWFQCIYDIYDDEKALAEVWKIDKGSYAGNLRREFKSIIIEIENPCLPNLIDRIPMIPEGKCIPNPIDPVIYPELKCDTCGETVKGFRMLDHKFFTTPCNHGVTKEYYEMYRPTCEQTVLKYFADYLFSDKLSKNEQYTYGSRIMEPVKINSLIEGGEVNPIWLELNNRYKKECGGEFCGGDENVVSEYPQFYYLCAYLRTNPRSNQIIMQIGKPSDVTLSDPPCLRHVDIQVKDGKLNWFIYFRSWDLWGGLPLNLCGLSFLMNEMCLETGFEPGMFVCHSKGLHLYEHSWSAALARLGR